MFQKKYAHLSRAKSRELRKRFSASFYLSQFLKSDRELVNNPLEHFLLHWKKNGFDPSSSFSMSGYLLANPDVAESGVNPFVHYTSNGIAENRPLVPVMQLSQGAEQIDEQIDDFCFKSSLKNYVETVQAPSNLGSYLRSIDVHFDWDPIRVDPFYYKSYFPEEIINECDRHYDENGWRFGLNPTSWFNTEFYLNFYPDVAASGMNPFLHFVNQGFLELRIPNDSHFRNFRAVLKSRSIEYEARAWVTPSKSSKTVNVNYVKREILERTIKNGRLVLSLGHSTYLSDVGGIQLYTFVEAQKFNALKMNYLHISPSRPLPVLADSCEKDLRVRITFNNEELLGDVLLSDLVEIVDAVSPDIPPIAFIVNSLYGWHPEALIPIVKRLASDRHFWIFHDYSTFCSNSTLNFENSFPCHNPKVGSGICSTCRFGQTRTEHVSRINQLLESSDWQLVTPSVSTSANIVKFLSIDSSQILTIPHGEINVGARLRNFQPKPRIAFVGQQVLNKGWLNFLNFVDAGLKDFDFYHFGLVNADEPGIRYYPLTNDFSNLEKARDLLVENKIDAVFICPTWEETFCFVAYEALAAGCQIICNVGSGNVSDAAFNNAIFYDVEDVQSIDRVKAEIIQARQADRFISSFVFSGTLASEYAK